MYRKKRIFVSRLFPHIALAFLLHLIPLSALAATACPPDGRDLANFYPNDLALFEGAIAKVATTEPSDERLSGIIVPHHLLADRLVALGFRLASASRYKRVVILSPDHFRRTTRPFATTARGFETVFGPVAADAEAVARLLAAGRGDVEESCLFAKEHGVQAMLPFIARYFPGARIVPVAISIRSKRKDWDRLADALAPLVDRETLVVESTDFSHFLPHHEARARDQQTLNVIASGSLDAIAALLQPQHADSVGALYVQTRLQQALFGAHPLIVANENSQDYSQDIVKRTTSYMVGLYGRFDAAFNNPPVEGGALTYLAGDVNFGRAMKTVLLRDGASERIAASILQVTKGRPLIVNLEGVILPNVPEGLDDMTLGMPEALTLAWLRQLNVQGVGLANNHAFDLGASGHAETQRALRAAGIPFAGQGETLTLPGFDIVALSDLDTNASRQADLITPTLLDRLVRPSAARPVVAFVHWGQEYRAQPTDREAMLADEMRLRAVTLIAGGHPHVASAALRSLGGGETLTAYSLGNFIFDQDAKRSSGALLELRSFAQGTLFVRQIPLPNFFDMARGK